MGISLSEGILLAHVAGAVAWLGAVLAFAILGTRVRARGDADEGVTFAIDHAAFTRVVALPGSLLVLLSGGWLMRESDLGIAEAWWLGAGIACWVVAFLGSTMLRGPQLTRVVRSAAERGAGDEDVRWQLRQVTLIARGELLLLSVALALMVLTPS